MNLKNISLRNYDETPRCSRYEWFPASGIDPVVVHRPAHPNPDTEYSHTFYPHPDFLSTIPAASSD
jgi:hypothetical protein